MGSRPERLDAAEVRMNPWRFKDEIAEDVKVWLIEYRDREQQKEPSIQRRWEINALLNGAMDYLEAMMCQAEGEAREELAEAHTSPEDAP